MKRFALPLPVILFFLTPVAAQNKLLSMEDAMLRARTTLAPQTLPQLQFYGNTNDYVYLKKSNGRDEWMRGGYKTKSDTVFLDLAGFNARLRKAGTDTLKAMPAIRFNPAGWTYAANGGRWTYDPVSGSVKAIVPKALADKENVEESAAGYIAYLDNFNLFVSDGASATQVTKDGSRDIVYASSVHRDEFGISKGTFWSPGGKRLAFYRMDQSMVTDYPIIDWSERPARADLIKYPMAGNKSHQVTVGVYFTDTKSTTWLQTGLPAEQYLTNIAWSPDERFVYIAVLNREQNHMWLNQYDAASGKFVRTLFEQTDDKYVEPLVPMLFLKNNPAQFIWQSNRDGWNHLYLYDTSGKLIKQLTKGNWEVLEVKGFDTKGEHLYYVSTALSPLNKNLYRLNLKTGLTSCLTPTPGVHSAQVSDDGNWVLDVYSTPGNPRTLQLLNVAKPLANPAKTLLQADNPLKEYKTGNLSIFPITNKKGDSLWCRLYQPVDMVAGKKYPVIVYWYGGPHAQLVLNSWNGGAGDYWFQYMAERGYVVFTVDTRGSDNRGKAFEQAIFRRLGEAQMEDMMSAIDYLYSQPYVDQKRMGLFGWSFGGFMTTDFVLNYPGIFRAAVAGGPVMDWKYYEIMYGERYMDTPQENKEGYEATNLINQAGKLKDKLLLIHGLQDPVVVQQHSVNFVKACVDKGVQVDYMIYPGHEHNVLGKDRAHLYQKVTDYFNTWLQ